MRLPLNNHAHEQLNDIEKLKLPLDGFIYVKKKRHKRARFSMKCNHETLMKSFATLMRHLKDVAQWHEHKSQSDFSWS